ncbi:MAG TPA: DNA polymerase I, partial [Planctomycetaceae bacterium]|nr:DNA polymerase I [Planctomycetaceae bacterium]
GPQAQAAYHLIMDTVLVGRIEADNLIVFSTNLDPRDLVDDAFLRRIRYKIKIDWEDARVGQADVQKLRRLFRELGFQRLAREVQHLVSQLPSRVAESSATDRQGELFARPETVERQWNLVDTPEKFESFLNELRTQKKFCVDLETTGLEEMRADIVGWAFSWKTHTGHYLPVQGPPGQRRLDARKVLEALRPMLEDPHIEVINQNIKYDMLVLRRAGVQLRGIGLDPMVGSYLLDAGARSHSLETLAEVYLGHRMIPIKDLIGSGRLQKSMADVDIETVAEYATEDADVAWQVATVIEDRLRSEGLWDLYWDLERPLISVLAEMEFAGIRVDVDELRRQSDEIGRQLDDIICQVYKLAGHEFNLDSPKQLRTILFDELNLPVLKKTKTGPSTDQSVLEKLALLHPLPERIIRHRQLAKLKNTYLDALPRLVNPETGKIHTSFQQVATATGRLSSTNPNLQNIPIRTEEGRNVRRAFVPS